MGATSGGTLYIYICFFRSVSISIPSTSIEFRALGHCVLSTTHFRLVVYISTPRYSSKFRVLREKSPIEIILPTPLTHFNHSTKTNILKGSFWVLQKSQIDHNNNLDRWVYNLDHVRLLQNPVLKYSLFLLNNFNRIIQVCFIIHLNFRIFWSKFIVHRLKLKFACAFD